jgi:eukaryotic translation initiation factor 2C
VNTRNREEVDKTLGNAKAGTNFALLVLKTKSAEAYSHFKDLCDRTYGYQSICVTQTALDGNRGQLMGNFILKMNLKTSGSNNHAAKGQMVAIMPNILVPGADVTHPGKGFTPGCPSISAIVGSVDKWGGRFLGSMRLQNKDKKEVCAVY